MNIMVMQGNGLFENREYPEGTVLADLKTTLGGGIVRVRRADGSRVSVENTDWGSFDLAEGDRLVPVPDKYGNG